MERLITIVGLILVPIGIIAWQHYEEKRADIVYALSEQVPFGAPTAGQDVLVQKVEVKNVGDIEAKDVVVKIQGDAHGLFTSKFSESDKVEINEDTQGAEITYQALRPGTSFRAAWQSKANSLAPRVTVVHSAGTGREALSRATASWWDIVAPIFMWIGTVAYGLLSLREALRSQESRLSNSRAANLPLSGWAKIDKPMLFSSSKWDKLRLSVLRKRIDDQLPGIGQISQSDAYNFLNHGPPEILCYIGDHELKGKSSKALKRAYTTEINGAHTVSQLEEIFAIPRPKDFDTWQYDELLAQGEAAAASLILRELDLQWYSPHWTMPLRPTFMRDETWGRLEERIEESRAGSIVRAWRYSRVDVKEAVEELMRLSPQKRNAPLAQINAAVACPPQKARAARLGVRERPRRVLILA